MSQLYATGNMGIQNQRIGGANFLKNIKNIVKKNQLVQKVVSKAGSELLKRVPDKYQSVASDLVNVASQEALNQASKQGLGKRGGKKVRVLRDINRFINASSKAINKVVSNPLVQSLAMGAGKRKPGRPRKVGRPRK
jgi:hypothetical protein